MIVIGKIDNKYNNMIDSDYEKYQKVLGLGYI
jgi:hypothetical protein